MQPLGAFSGTVQCTSTDVPNMCHSQASGAQGHSQVHTWSSTGSGHCNADTATGFLLAAQAWYKCTSGNQDPIWTHKTLMALDVVTCDTPFSVWVELLCKEGTADGLCCPRGWDTMTHCTHPFGVTRVQLCHSRCFSVSSFTPSS